MIGHFTKNEAFLRNIYRKGQFDGHGLICYPKLSLPSLPDYTISTRPVAEWVPNIVRQYEEHAKFSMLVGDDQVPFAQLITGTHIYAAAFGCGVHVPPNDNPCAMPLVKTSVEADRLEEPDIWSSPTLCRVFELGRLVQRELGNDAFLGPSDVQSGFDTAAIIWDKTDFYVAMMTEPDAVKRLAEKCSRLLKKFLFELRREFPRMSWCHCPSAWSPPEMGPWLSNDECGAFGTEQFGEFCLPEMIDLAETFGGLGMHCCANAEHQFASFQKIPNLYAFNRVDSRNNYRTLLPHFSGPLSPVYVLAWLGDDAIEHLIKTADNHARFIFVQYDKSEDDARSWVENMRSLSERHTVGPLITTVVSATISE